MSMTKRHPRVFVERREALGDAILVTPFLRHLKKTHLVHFASKYAKYWPELTDFTGCVRDAGVVPGDVRVQLNGAYETRPHMHILHAYEEVFKEHGLPTPDLTQTGPYLSSQDHPMEEWMKNKKYIAVHMAQTWRAKKVKFHIIEDVLKKLISHYGYYVAIVGTGDDFGSKLAKWDLRGQLNIHQTRRVIERASVFIGIDSGPLHVAATTQTPQVGLYTVVKGELVAPLHKKESLIVNADTSCINCLKRLPPPVEKHWCTSERPFHCVESFSGEKILEEMSRLGFV